MPNPEATVNIDGEPPLRISVGLTPYDRWGGIQPILSAAKRADELGYSAVSFPDHMVMPVTPGRDPVIVTWYDDFVLAAAVAAATDRIRMVFNALVIPYRHPVDLAKRISTLDVVSQGRLTIVCGTGWMRREFSILGVPFEERGPRTDDAIRAMKALWTEAQPQYKGEFYSFAPVNFEPKCVQKPHVPLWIGGSGARPFRRAVELGDGWMPMTGSLSEVGDSIRDLKERLASAGRDPKSYTFGFSLQVGEVDETARAASQHVARGRSASSLNTTSAQETIDALGHMQSLGINHVGLHFAWRTPSQFEEKLQELAETVLAKL